MEIKVNDRDKLYLISSIVGFIAFFLPWVGGGILGQHSGYDLLNYGQQMGADKSWFLILLPASFFIISLSKLGVIKNISPSLVKIIEIIPIALILFSFAKLMDSLGIKLEDLEEMDSDFLQIFKIGFYLTLISSIIAVFAPVNKTFTSVSSSNIIGDKKEEINFEQKGQEIGHSIAEGGKKISEMINSLFLWFKGNPRIVVAIGVFLVIFLSLYFIFIKDYPKKEGRELASELCNCYENYNKEISKTYNDFIDSFDSSKFKKRSEARKKLSDLTNPIENSKYNSIDNINKKYERIRIKYSQNNKNLSKFETSYRENQNNCSNTGISEIQNLYSTIEKKIGTIKDPLPDIEKIKTDLLGHKILTWNCDALSEFKEASIIKLNEGSNFAEFHIKLHLVGYRNPTTDIHDADVLVIYIQSNEGWYFNDIKPIYYTQNYIAPSNSWATISFRNLPNVSYTIIHNGQKFWIKESYYGTKYKGGPDGDPYHLSSNEIYIMSRESGPVTLTFKFTPNN